MFFKPGVEYVMNMGNYFWDAITIYLIVICWLLIDMNFNRDCQYGFMWESYFLDILDIV